MPYRRPIRSGTEDSLGLTVMTNEDLSPPDGETLHPADDHGNLKSNPCQVEPEDDYNPKQHLV